MLIPALLTAIALAAGSWPIDPPQLVSSYDPPEHAWSAGHRGVDFAAHTGSVVRAMADGTVTFTGVVAGKRVLVIAVGGARRLTYEPVLATVAVGSIVEAGDPIGTVAAAGGHCGGIRGCLHVGLRDAKDYLDPLSLVERGPAVLKPVSWSPRGGHCKPEAARQPVHDPTHSSWGDSASTHPTTSGPAFCAVRDPSTPRRLRHRARSAGCD